MGKQSFFGELLAGGLGHAEVDHLWDRLAVVDCHHNVRRLDVAVDDALLMRVLDRMADRNEEFQPLARSQPLLVAILGDRQALDQLHGEVGPAAFGRARIKHLGNVRMVHDRQRLPLGLETGDDLAGVHARLDDLQRHPTHHRLALLGHVDHAHAALANLLQQLVGADLCARLFEGR